MLVGDSRPRSKGQSLGRRGVRAFKRFGPVVSAVCGVSRCWSWRFFVRVHSFRC